MNIQILAFDGRNKRSCEDLSCGIYGIFGWPIGHAGAFRMSEVILDVQDLSIIYHTLGGIKKAVNQVSFQIFKDEIFGLVGESGSGKSSLCYGLLRLVPPPGEIENGVVNYYGENLLALQGEKLRQTRWRDISFIPQGAMSSLNPVVRIREQMADAILDHEARQTRSSINRRIETILESVNLPVSVADKFPHELSGGMKQRVCIALAVILKPKLILADEPTSALDVVSQRIVLEMLSEVRQSLQASMILVGHDMALQAQVAHRLGIMYGGSFMEIGTVQDIFDDPIHPYTQRLISSIPSIRKRQDIHALAQSSFSEKEKSQYLMGNKLVEVNPGHFAAVYNG
jgi:peptide/nickel transport system ATP-binding protein